MSESTPTTPADTAAPEAKPEADTTNTATETPNAAPTETPDNAKAKPDAAAAAGPDCSPEEDAVRENLAIFIKAVNAKDFKPLDGLTDEELGAVFLNGLVAYRVKKNDPTLSTGAADAKTIKIVEKAVIDLKADEMLKTLRHLYRISLREADKQLGSYSNVGFLYAGVPLGVDFGIELGIRTGEDGEEQCTGLVIGLRSDQLAKRKATKKTLASTMK